MNLARHYDDETIIALLESGDPEAIARDPHLAGCESCAELAESLRAISGTLAHEDVWDARVLDEAPRPETLANLRAFVGDMAREDAIAEQHLKDLLAGDRDTWMPRLHAHPEYRTAGMVRKLVAATDHALDTMPPDAVAITELATEIADNLPPAVHPGDTVLKLRGAAWRERAYALFYVGTYTEAETAIAEAERNFAECVVGDYDRGRVAIVLALIHRALDRDTEAAVTAAEAVTLLRASGDVQRYVSAVMVQAQAKMKVFEYRGALGLLTEALTAFRVHVSADTEGRLLANIGLCQRALRDFAGAVSSYRTAARIFNDLGVRTEAVRTQTNLAVVLREAGLPEEAVRQVREARSVFESLGMTYDLAMTDLILSDLAITNGDLDAVGPLCRHAMSYFEGAGLAYGPRALTALAYLSEAAEQHRLTSVDVRHVENYIRRLPLQPALLFAPLPE